jgi:hypothetical protein
MFLAGRAAGAGIVFLLLTTVISGRPAPTPPLSGANLGKEVPPVVQRNDVRKMQKAPRCFLFLWPKPLPYKRRIVQGEIRISRYLSQRSFLWLLKVVNLPVTASIPVDCDFWSEDDGWKGVCKSLSVTASGAGVSKMQRRTWRLNYNITTAHRTLSVILN